MRKAILQFLQFNRKRFITIPPYDTTVIETRLNKGIIDAQERFKENKRSAPLYDATAGGNFFGNMFDMYVRSKLDFHLYILQEIT